MTAPHAPARRMAVTLAALLALALALPLAVAAPARAQAPGTGFDIRLEPENPDAVHARGAASTVIASGQVPPGQLQDARIVGLDDRGTRVEQVVSSRDPQNENYVAVQGTELSGRITLNACFGADPNRVCPTPNTGVRSIQLQVTVDGATGSGPAGGLPNDYTRPAILRFDLVATDQIVAVFTEPVRFPPSAVLQIDRAEDWTVGGGAYRVQRVENACAPPGSTGRATNVLCDRRRLFTSTIPEDLEPTVRYVPGGAIGEQPSYIDAAANVIDVTDVDGSTGNGTTAADRVIPARPEVEAVAGRTPSAGRVAWRDRSPVLSLSNLTVGHRLHVVRDGGSSPILGPVDVTATSQDVALPDLGSDRDGIRLAVVAVDPAGNCSQPDGGIAACADTAEGSPPRRDGADNPVLYDLDTQRPRAVAATLVDSRTVDVTFSEPVTPAGSAGTFTAGDARPTAVEGQGATRRLTFGQPVVAAALAWRPEPNGYVDRVQLGLEAFERPITPLPIPPAPVVEVPAARVVTNADAIPVAGRLASTPATPTVVELYEDAQATRRVGQDLPVEGGRWSGELPLPAGDDLVTTFRRYARSRDAQTGVRSPMPPAETVEITVDRRPPALRITSPQVDDGPLAEDPEPVGRGQEIEVTWTATDDFPRSFELVLLDADGAASPCDAPVFTAERDTWSGTCRVPEDAPAGDATIRLVASDQAGNRAEDAVAGLPIDPLILGAVGALVDNAPGDVRIELDFGRPLSGSTSALDWRTNDGRGDTPSDRAPGRAALSEDREVVVLDAFLTPFPGPAQGHPNARPAYTYQPGLGGPLTGPDGERLATTGRVRDVTPPLLEGVAADYGTVNGERQRPLAGCEAPGADCPDGPVLVVRGRTDRAFDYGAATPDRNSIRVHAGTVDFADERQADRATPVADAVVAEDGTWTAVVPLAPNAVQSFTIRAVDIHGSQDQPPTTAVFQVVEDSLGPVVTRLTASLDVRGEDPEDDVITISGALDEPASAVLLEHRLGDGAWQPIDEVAPGGQDAFVFRWDDLPFDPAQLDAAGLEIRATATDLIGNVGLPRTTGLSALPRLLSAEVVDEDTLRVRTSEPVTTEQAGAAGFSVVGGPGVASATAEGPVLELELADPLTAEARLVRYGGQGGWTTADGRPLQAGEVPLTLPSTTLLPVTDLVAGPSGTGAVLSFVDERNDPAVVTGYEVARDGVVVRVLDPDERVLQDPDLPPGTYTYAVSVLGPLGTRSAAVTATAVLGPPPDGVPAPDQAGGGSGAPDGAPIAESCPFPPQPNITPAGGTVLSCDGRVAALVPAGVVDVPAYGAILRRSRVDVGAFTPTTDLYQLVAVADADGFPVVDAVDGYVELSFRDLRDELLAQVPERVTALRVADREGARVVDETASRVGAESVATHLVTLGTLGVAEADGATVRVWGPDPALPPDRFSTAAGLSQTRFRVADAAVIARADDYPDALAAAPLAAQVGGPVLLSRTTDVPTATLYELARLGTSTAYLVGGEVALSQAVEAQLAQTGLQVVRVAGDTRFDTAAEVARRVGSADGGAFVATGQGFADALAASAPAAAAGRPILLATTDGLPAASRVALDDVGITAVDVVGGEVAIGADVSQGLDDEGFSVRRSGGTTRYGTAVALANALVGDGVLQLRQLVVASGEGDGVTSPDALAAGPVGGLLRGPLLLTPRDGLAPEAAELLAGATGLRGAYLAGGEVALTPRARAEVDAAAGD
jgi:putative cell wall-binding protein